MPEAAAAGRPSVFGGLVPSVVEQSNVGLLEVACRMGTVVHHEVPDHEANERRGLENSGHCRVVHNHSKESSWGYLIVYLDFEYRYLAKHLGPSE